MARRTARADHAVRRDRAQRRSCSKAGREFKACCPFHNEKTPSFTVNDEKGFYHCFGCGAHGDAIRWMTDQRGLPFMDAVKELRPRPGWRSPPPDPRARRQAEQPAGLHDVMAAAQDWFVEQLARARGRRGARLSRRRAGSTRDDGRALRLRLCARQPQQRSRRRSQQFGEDKLIEAGLRIAGGRQGALRPLPRPADVADPRCRAAG